MKTKLAARALPLVCIALVLSFTACSHNSGGGDSPSDTPGSNIWARTANPAGGASEFLDIAADSAGNWYAAGILNSDQTYDFGNGQTLTGKSAYGNVVLVKYNSAGVAQWARSVAAGPSSSSFSAVTIDTSGNIYAAGFISETGEYDFGNSVTVSAGGSEMNAVLVKYNASGVAQWARSVVSTGAGVDDSPYSSIAALATDSTGAVYAAGYIQGNWDYNFGNSVTVTGGSAKRNALLLKYNASGDAQWAESVESGADDSDFSDIAIDSSDDIYVTGYQYKIGEYSYGNSQTFTGAYDGKNAIVGKYSASGYAQWVRGATQSGHDTEFSSVSVSASGTVVVAGNVFARNPTDFGTVGAPVSVTGAALSNNALLVAYTGTGTAQWARITSGGSSYSYYEDLAIATNGDIYACGIIRGGSTYSFGTGVSATGAYAGGQNIVIAQFSSGGTAQWAYTTAVASENTGCDGIALSATGKLALAGSLRGAGSFNFGTGLVAGGSSGKNALIAAFRD